MNRLPLALSCGLLVASLLVATRAAERTDPEPVVPGAHWQTREPIQVGLSRPKLDALRDLVGGRGCVVRHGYLVYTWGDPSQSGDVASAVKPVISTLLFLAVQEGKLSSVDERVADVEPRLKTLNGGKDAGITWRHLASQTSGYGLAEPPGAAWAYNDSALALYYDTLTEKVFRTNGTELLRTRLAEPLQFEDRYTFDAFGRADRQGRLAISVRDFARFGLLYLRHGRWRDQQLLQPEFVRMALHNPISPLTPRTRGQEAAMLPGQRTLGGGRDQTPTGPGFYSFNWWLNGTNVAGQRLFVAAPPDAFAASGHGGKRVLFVVPSLDLIVSWNDSGIEDHDASPGNPKTKMNQAVHLLCESVAAPASAPASVPASAPGFPPGRPEIAGRAAATHLGIQGTRFTLNGQPAFLYGLSLYGALGEPDDLLRRDLNDAQRWGFNWIRVWATWAAFGNNFAAVNADGSPREPFLTQLQHLTAECDRRGLVVDLTLSRGNGVAGAPRLETHAAHRRAVETLVTALKPWRNWYLDLSNERNIQDARHTSMAELTALREVVQRLDPERLVTASHGGDLNREELRAYLETVKVDFIAPHRPRDAGSAGQTAVRTREYLEWMKAIGRVVPVHYQEPFRRGYGQWQPHAADFVTDLRGALEGGAAGWCFHNGDQRDAKDGRPRRSFDLTERRLFEQLDAEEQRAVELLRPVVTGK